MSKKITLGLILFFIAIFIILLVFYEKLKIGKVYIISDRQDLNGLEVFNSANLFLTDPQAVASQLKQKNILVKSITVTKQYPDILILDITLRTPYAVVENNGIFTTIDEDGIYIKRDNREDLPIIYQGSFGITPNMPADWRVNKSLSLIKGLKKNNITVKKITIDDSKSIFRLSTLSGLEILIPYSSDPSTIATSLQLIITRFRIEGKIVKTVDFQFDKPVVTLTNEK